MCNDAYLPDDEQSEEEHSEYLIEQYYAEWAAEQAHLASQDGLPEHKKDGYAEKMNDLADMIRRAKQEQGL